VGEECQRSCFQIGCVDPRMLVFTTYYEQVTFLTYEPVARFRRCEPLNWWLLVRPVSERRVCVIKLKDFLLFFFWVSSNFVLGISTSRVGSQRDTEQQSVQTLSPRRYLTITIQIRASLFKYGCVHSLLVMIPYYESTNMSRIPPGKNAFRAYLPHFSEVPMLHC
jgi:hypothetical protein